MFYNTLELLETYIKLDFRTHTMNLHGKRTRQCGTVMPGNEVQALQPTGNNVPASLQKFGKKNNNSKALHNIISKSTDHFSGPNKSTNLLYPEKCEIILFV